MILSLRKLQGFQELCARNQGQRPVCIFPIIPQPALSVSGHRTPNSKTLYVKNVFQARLLGSAGFHSVLSASQAGGVWANTGFPPFS